MMRNLLTLGVSHAPRFSIRNRVYTICPVLFQAIKANIPCFTVDQAAKQHLEDKMKVLNIECSEIEEYVTGVKARYDALQKQINELNREKVSILVSQYVYQIYLIHSNSWRSIGKRTGNLRPSGNGSSSEPE